MGSGWSIPAVVTLLAILFHFSFSRSSMNEPNTDAAVIWFHGLGDTYRGWSFLKRQFSQKMPWVRWVFPNAPTQPVTCNGGARMTSWFDIIDIPVGPEEPDSPDGLEESIANVHAIIEKLEQEGVPPERIVVGGFSQGAVLSMAAGIRFPKKLAGIVGFSGWVTKKDELQGLLGDNSSAANAKTPMLVCHGRADNVVLFSLGRQGVELMSSLGASVTFESYPGVGHSSCPQELAELQEFLLQNLPEQPRNKL
uniref:Phospholipase/carboxylesterase/thioesterase domain-containing protein n=1 Tax=Fibrocapsa japonica TaxID=94617 RepID=A0A7S2V262_9STRA|mmetsp:Transcript_3657/g.5418  ORF Transcript_3657/g.5418 Transcript_3657/m.5418 type:complete len:252 (+) Transcript_3657:4-759(+)